MDDFTILYVGTAAMLLLAISLILFVIWASSVMRKHRKLAEQRDKNWTERIQSIEKLVKEEFQELLKALKI